MMKHAGKIAGGFVAGSLLGAAAAAGAIMCMPSVGNQVKRKLRKHGVRMLQNFM